MILRDTKDRLQLERFTDCLTKGEEAMKDKIEATIKILTGVANVLNTIQTVGAESGYRLFACFNDITKLKELWEGELNNGDTATNNDSGVRDSNVNTNANK